MAETTSAEQPGLPAHLRDDLKWKPGQSGNPAGRPKSSRNKLGEAFLAALHDDFINHGAAAIIECREKKPEVYVRVIAGLLPSEHRLTIDDQFSEMTDAELAERARQLAEAIAPLLVDGTGAPATGVGSTNGKALASRVH